jgi:hypothetical protein
LGDVIEEARRLKSEAMDARDVGQFDRAVRLLGRAERGLRSTLEELKGARKAEEPPGRQETAVANQLVHILGSTGGVLRRKGDYGPAARFYDAGWDFEKPAAGYGIVNSYNLVQRLVARLFLEPRAVADNLEVEGLRVREELDRARQEIERQIAGERNKDEYAAADLATVLLLLGDPVWMKILDGFLMSRPEPYAVQVTLETLEALSARATASPNSPPDLAERLSQAIAHLRNAS